MRKDWKINKLINCTLKTQFLFDQQRYIEAFFPAKGIKVNRTKQTIILSFSEYLNHHLQDETTLNVLFLIADQGNHLWKKKNHF